MPEYVAFISSKSGVDTSRDGKVMSVAKKVWTDRQMAFRLYIVDIYISRLTIVSCEAKKKQRPLSELFTWTTTNKLGNAQAKPP